MSGIILCPPQRDKTNEVRSPIYMFIYGFETVLCHGFWRKFNNTFEDRSLPICYIVFAFKKMKDG